jgi:DNA-binding MarR family transcriptional regulator
MLDQSEARDAMTNEKPFKNDRLTYRLNVIADQAISANEAIFLRDTGCNIRELRVLRLIDDSPGTSFAEIARITGFERSLTSRIIQNLIAAELILRENSTTDARVFQLSTTEKGREVRRIGRALSDRLEAVLTRPLSESDLETLNQLLWRLGKWVSSSEYQDLLAQE